MLEERRGADRGEEGKNTNAGWGRMKAQVERKEVNQEDERLPQALKRTTWIKTLEQEETEDEAKQKLTWL